MHHQPVYQESEESWAERQRHVALLPGQEICDCGQIMEHDERHGCASCGHAGCIYCMRLADDTGDAELNDDWVCGDDCEIEWLESLAAANERDHRNYQDFIAKRIEAVHLRKTG